MNTRPGIISRCCGRRLGSRAPALRRAHLLGLAGTPGCCSPDGASELRGFQRASFPFGALVFLLPKGTVRHPTDGDCPFLVLSRTTKGQNLSLPMPGLDFRATADQDAVLLTTDMPEAEFNVKKYWRCERQMTRNLVEAYRFAVTFNHVSRAARLIHRSAFAID
jgi:hypothetical protein